MYLFNFVAAPKKVFMPRKYWVRLLFIFLLSSNFISKANFLDDTSKSKSNIWNSDTDVPREDSYLKLANNIQRYAKKFIGIHYKRGGKTAKGFDCSGFVGFVFKKFGMKLGDCSTEMSKLGYNIELSTALPGDLIFFRRSKNPKSSISHVGIVVEDFGMRV